MQHVAKRRNREGDIIIEDTKVNSDVVPKEKPLVLIVYIKKILEYIESGPEELLNLKLVNVSWYETITAYSKIAWLQSYNDYANKNMFLKIAIKNRWPFSMTCLILQNVIASQTPSETSQTLHFSCEYGNIECTKFFLENGADKDTKDSSNRTPLHTACWNGQTKCAKLLLENCADKDAKDVFNQTPLHGACLVGYTECAKLLLENGADKEAKNSYDNGTPLHYACTFGKPACVKLLLEHGADKNSKDSYGKTALCRASWDGQTEYTKLLLECRKLLLESGADEDVKNALVPFPFNFITWLF